MLINLLTRSSQSNKEVAPISTLAKKWKSVDAAIAKDKGGDLGWLARWRYRVSTNELNRAVTGSGVITITGTDPARKGKWSDVGRY